MIRVTPRQARRNTARRPDRTLQTAAVCAVLLAILFSVRAPRARAQASNFCPSSGIVYGTYKGIQYIGGASQERNGMLDGIVTQTYAYSASGTDGSTISGHFTLSAVDCLITPNGAFTSVQNATVEYYTIDGIVYNGGGGLGPPGDCVGWCDPQPQEPV